MEISRMFQECFKGASRRPNFLHFTNIWYWKTSKLEQKTSGTTVLGMLSTTMLLIYFIESIYLLSELDALEPGLLLVLVDGLVVLVMLPESLLDPGLDPAWSMVEFSMTDPNEILALGSMFGSDWSDRGILSSKDSTETPFFMQLLLPAFLHNDDIIEYYQENQNCWLVSNSSLVSQQFWGNKTLRLKVLVKAIQGLTLIQLVSWTNVALNEHWTLCNSKCYVGGGGCSRLRASWTPSNTRQPGWCSAAMGNSEASQTCIPNPISLFTKLVNGIEKISWLNKCQISTKQIESM